LFQYEYKEPPAGSLNKIRVIVRVRPLLEEETKGSEETGLVNCLKIRDQANEIE
jgi:hypothetical protein